MLELLEYLIESPFMPHGHCYFWTPSILWSYAVSDSIIALAYLIIPLSLVKIVKKRDDFTYMWMIALFAVFILGCGTTHIFDVINIWKPLYQLDIGVRVITALASIGTAATLMVITPKLVLIPSAEQWRKMNEELRLLNEDLEKKVQERTAELRQSAAKFEFLTDTIPQIIWTANPEGEADYFNKNWYDYSGLTFEQSKGESWNSVIHPDDIESFTVSWQKALQNGIPFQREFRIRNASDQSFRWHLGRALPMTDENGEVTKWFATATDVHDQRTQHEELKKINEELDNFVYTASHDLKAPISNLEGLLTLIYRKCSGQVSEEVTSLFDMMKKQIGKLKDIIRDLSDVGRIQKEAAENFEVVDMVAVYEEFLVSHQEIIAKTGAIIRSDFQQAELFFSIRLLRSLVYNLLDNSLKYRASDKKPLIDVKTFQEKGYFVLTVEDNGIGVESEHIPKLFNMFTRFNRDQEGTGIGLYMVKRIAEKYQGKIEIESRIGEGTLVKVYLAP
jgi:PAS domain S-box-containing protein